MTETKLSKAIFDIIMDEHYKKEVEALIEQLKDEYYVIWNKHYGEGAGEQALATYNEWFLKYFTPCNCEKNMEGK